MAYIEELTVREMQEWIEGQGAHQRRWRTDTRSAKDVAQLVDRYVAETGKARAPIMRRIEEERRQVAAELAEQERISGRVAQLRAILKRQWLENGGSDIEFESNWPDMHQELLRSGRADEVIERDKQERRRRAARTF